MRISLATSLTIACAAMALAQEQKFAFDVVSIRPNTTCATNGGGSAGMPRVAPGRINMPCVTLRLLLNLAYNANATTAEGLDAVINAGGVSRVIEGPKWVDTDRYDVSATAPGNPSAEQMRGRMLLALLVDRFNVKVHRESRDTAVYELTVKDASKLHAAKDPNCVPIRDREESAAASVAADAADNKTKTCGPRNIGTLQNQTTEFNGVTMAELAALAFPTYIGQERPIIDKTGLKGRYDFHLEYTRPSTGMRILNGVVTVTPDPPSTEMPGPSFFTVIQEQLGLKLTASKDPVEVIVLDYAEKPPPN